MIIKWILENLIQIITLLIAFSAFWKSHQANLYAKESNAIAIEANQIARSYLRSDETYKKLSRQKEILDFICENWSKNGGAERHLLSQWSIAQSEGFTKEDFDSIWRNAYLIKKHKTPKQSFQEILLNHEKI